MCLVDNKLFRFTFKRIPVYKVVYESSDGRLYSPYQCTPITKEMHGNVVMQQHEYNSESYIFGNGFIHAYSNKHAAQCLIDDLWGWKNHKIIEGYIPAFTRYAINIYSPFPQLVGNVGSICARRMVFPNV